MPLVLWAVCWLACIVAFVCDFVWLRHRADARQNKFWRLAEASLLVVATGAILKYKLDDHRVPGSHSLRLLADAIEFAGFLGAVACGLAARAIPRPRTVTRRQNVVGQLPSSISGKTST